MTSCSLALACGDSGSDGNDQAEGETAEAGTEQGTDDEVGTDGNTTTMGDGDGDTFTTTMGDGDGDTMTDTTTMGDGDGDTMTDTTMGDGDGDTMTDTTMGDGDGDTMTDTTDGSGSETATTGEECGTTLYSTVRDFQIAHPDFEYTIGVDYGIVETDLGMDKKPVYAGNPVTPTTTGAANFNQWYNDVNGVNQSFDVPIDLVEIQPGLYHHFTLELHSKFQYMGGEVFGFEGDDDLWVFVNDQLGIDLGGVHGPLSGQIDMDAMAGQLGLQIGGVYDLDFFFAERHTSQSNFEITTTISCFDPQ
jgi:fibro-slime domain-containing protein